MWRIACLLFVALTACGRIAFDPIDEDGGFTGSVEAYVKASNSASGDNFGAHRSVALSADGNTLAVGAPFEDSSAVGIDGDPANNAAPNSGAVYVFMRDANGWTPHAYVKASNTGGSDGFGVSVALSGDGNTLAVGAWYEDSGIVGNEADNSLAEAGAVYVFVRAAGTWAQQAYVKASAPGSSDFFGGAVALSADGNTLAVGAWLEDSAATGIGGDETNNAAPDSGAVYVFTRAGTTWSQEAYIKASNTDAVDNFGYVLSLAADGNTLAVRSAGESSAATGVDGNQADNSAAGSGAVYVFARVGTTWTQQAYLKASNTDSLDNFGYHLALSADGRTLAIGARFEDSAATGVGGDETNNTALESGAVYVFTRAGTAWMQEAYVKASNTGAGDIFGYAVAISGDGNVLVVGARDEDSSATGTAGDPADEGAPESGAIYIFVREGTSWSHSLYIKASNTNAGDLFGISVAISSDAVTVAASAEGEDSAATNVGGNQTDNSALDSGAVYVLR